MARLGRIVDAVTVAVYLPLMLAPFPILAIVVWREGLSPLLLHRDQWMFALLHAVVMMHAILICIGVRAALALLRPAAGPPTALASWWGRARRSVLLWVGIVGLLWGPLALIAGLDALAMIVSRRMDPVELWWSVPFVAFGGFLLFGGWRAVSLGRARLSAIGDLLASGERAEGSLLDVTRRRSFPTRCDILNVMTAHITYEWSDIDGRRHSASEDLIDDPYDHWSERRGVVLFDPVQPLRAVWVGRDTPVVERPAA